MLENTIIEQQLYNQDDKKVSPTTRAETVYFKDGTRLSNTQISEVMKTIDEKIESSYSNPNLLINPDFRINQRGKSSYSSEYAYSVDRWIFSNLGDSGTFDLSTVITAGHASLRSAGPNKIYIVQPLEPYTLRKGRYTFSAKVDVENLTYGNYTIFVSDSVNTIAKAVFTEGGIISVTFDVTHEQATTSVIRLFIGSINNTTTDPEMDIVNTEAVLKIYWTKLEAGEKATLFSTPNFASEFLKCKRYFQVLSDYVSRIFAYDANTFYIRIYYDIMRIKPTVTLFTENMIIRTYSYNTSVTGFSFSPGVTVENSFTIWATKTAHGVPDGNISCSGKTAFLDAEIY